MKRIKMNLVAIAMLLGISAALAFKAPEKKNVDQLYGRKANNSWELVGTRTPGTGAGQYTCDNASKACTAYFSSQPAAGANPDADDIEEIGVYVIH